MGRHDDTGDGSEAAAPGPRRMHAVSTETEGLVDLVLDYSRRRILSSDTPLDRPQAEYELRRLAGNTIVEEGIGATRALELFENVLAPACITTDHPQYLSFIPTAPDEGRDRVRPGRLGQRRLRRLLARRARVPSSPRTRCSPGWPASSGCRPEPAECSCRAARSATCRRSSPPASTPAPEPRRTVSDARIAGRSSAAPRRTRRSRRPRGSWTSRSSRSRPATSGALAGDAVREALDEHGASVFAVVATAGSTNFGIVDDIASIAALKDEFDFWLHVDGAYGLAGMLSPLARHHFAGVERADSVIVDPHKWLFAPFDACALIYADPETGRRAHTQHAEYLDTLTETTEWSPSDYAAHLTRRARGLPLWFSLATYGETAYRDAISASIQLARDIADEIDRRDGLRLVRQPQLSVVVFERDGWTRADYAAWSARLLDEQRAFVTPSSHQGRPNTRFAIVNPMTTFDQLTGILDTM